MVSSLVKAKVDRTKSYCRYRKFSPEKCDKRSFRALKPDDNTLITICCEKGKWQSRKKRCKVSMKRQSVAYKHKGKRCKKGVS